MDARDGGDGGIIPFIPFIHVPSLVIRQEI